MSIYQIPVTSLPNQTFNTTIPSARGNNIVWVFKFSWNLCTDTWEMSIYKISEENPVALNIPVMVSEDLLPYMSYKDDFGRIQVLNMGKSTLDKPSRNNLGTEYIIIWDNLDGNTVD